ncbi:hypothetical protein Trydic_g5819 [Trypoxylus dichotomus]
MPDRHSRTLGSAAPFIVRQLLLIMLFCSDYVDVPQSRVTRHQLIEQQLQQKTRNTQPTMTMKIGMMVVIKEDRVPPAQWHLRRIVYVHPQEDEVTRIIHLYPGEDGVSRVIHRYAEEDVLTRVVTIQSNT